MMTLFLSLALAAAAAENPPADGATTTTQPAKPVKPKKICKATRMTGSSIGRRVCKTQEQWDAIAADGAQALDLVDQGYKANTGNGSVN
jgi:hypothetical protein